MDVFAWLSNIYRWKIYSWHVSYALRKTKRLKCIKQCKLFAVCHGGSIWSMIDIKGCLRKSVHKLVILCELTFLHYVYNRFSPNWFVSLFQVRFWTLIPAFPQVSTVLLWFVIFTRSGDERTCLRHSFERRNQSQIIGHFLNNKSVAHPLVIIYK